LNRLPLYQKIYVPFSGITEKHYGIIHQIFCLICCSTLQCLYGSAYEILCHR